MDNIEFNIAKEYSRCPGARYKAEGDFAGEEFRDDYLVPRINKAIKDGVKLIIVLDGSAGYSTAFLEEAFGGLIRVCKMDYGQIMNTIRFVSDEDPTYIDDINAYLKDAYEHS